MARLNLYSDNYNDATVISNRFFDEYMKDANDAQLKVYLYLVRVMSSNLTTSISDIADKFNHTEKEIIRSLKYWEKVHLLQLDYDEQKNIVGIHMEDLSKSSDNENSAQSSGQNAQIVAIQPKLVTTATVSSSANAASSGADSASFKKPAYTAEDLEKFSSNPDITQIIFVAETYLGKTLSENEMKSLLFIYDVLGLSVELMDYLLEYCVGKEKKDLKYIEKVAIDWAGSNIKTVRQAKLRANKYDKTIYAVMKALGRTSAPTDTEAAFISKWLKEYAFSPDTISYACEKAVLATDSHRIEYTEGILSRWYAEGLKTREQIKNSEQKFQQTKKAVKASVSAVNKFNDFKQNSYDFTVLEQEILSN